MKKFVSLFFAFALIACLCACGTQPAQTQQSEQQPAQNEPAAPAEEAAGETIRLKVWGSQSDQELLRELCEAFGAELEAHSEGDLQRMLDQLVEQATAK